MKLLVNTHKIEIKKELINEKEINVTRCEFEFSEEITDDFVKEAYFTINGKSYKEIIINDECAIPYEVIEQEGQVEVGVVTYVIDNEEILKRYNPSPAYFNILNGSLKDNAENSEPITPSEMEQFEQALQDGINQISNINITAQETETGGIVEVTNKDGETTTIELKNGEDGEQGPRGPKGDTGNTGPSGIDGKDGLNGQDATINGVNTLTIEAGENITLEQEGSTLTISSTGGSGGTSDYSNLSNKPKINNVELSGNKTTSDLGIEIPDVSNFITKDVNNLTYYTLATGTGSTIELNINSSTYVMTLNLKNSAGTTISTDTIDLPLETMVVGGSYDDQTKKIILTLKNGETIEFSVADLVSGLQSEITSSNKLSSDLVDDTNNTNKFVTTSEKNTWNAKSDFSGSYNDLTDKPTIPTVPTNVSAFTNDAGYTTNTGTITSVKMNGSTISSSGEADLGTVITQHQDISGKEDKSNKVTSISSSSTDIQYPSAKCVYDLTNDLLHYKGHVNTTDNLPSTGQSSETPLQKSIYLINNLADISTTTNPHTSDTTWYDRFIASNWRNYGQYFALIVNSSSYKDQKIAGYVTDYPEQLALFVDEVTNGKLLGLVATYDANKPIYLIYNDYYNRVLFNQINSNSSMMSQMESVYNSSYSGNSTGYFDKSNGTTNIRLFLNTKLKYKPYDVDANSSIVVNVNGSDFVYSGNNYVLKNSVNNTPILVTSESETNINDTYTVGVNNEIYTVSSNYTWEHWANIDISGKLDTSLIEEKDMIVTYTDETTETIKLVVYK